MVEKGILEEFEEATQKKFEEALLKKFEEITRNSKPRADTKKRHLLRLLAVSVVLLSVSVVLAGATGNWAYGAAPLLLVGIIWTVVFVHYCIVHRETLITFFCNIIVCYGLPLLIFAILDGIYTSVSSIHWGILWRFVGTALGITAGVDLLIWGFVKASTGDGLGIDPTHEWRIVTQNGSPGARVGPATMKDLYEHTHGHGSWERRNTRRGTTGAVLASLTVVICPLCEIPFLLNSGVQGFGPIIGYFLIYPLLPLAVIGGVIYWLWRLYPPLNIR
jgi:hypothetical protein